MAMAKIIPYDACENPLKHLRPKVNVLNEHHILPVPWGGDKEKFDKVCGTCHDSIHQLLNFYVKFKGIPPLKILADYDRYTKSISQYAWDHRIPDHPIPYTFNCDV